ncbi:MAG: FAD-dependent thymidylate synthase, partial [Patescibacteria group bacterium]|nr:FAD-dependent thymidylate synthase [Patescibacteria group bacterium]
ELLPKVTEYFAKKYPAEPPLSVKTKAFDTLRGLLPAATLSQVAFFGNGQAFEYSVNRAKTHPLGELRWAAYAAKQELDKVIPAFLYRTEAEATKEYQEYLQKKHTLAFRSAEKLAMEFSVEPARSAMVKLLEYDPEGEEKILAALLYPQTHENWATLLEKVKNTEAKKRGLMFEEFFAARKARWYKVPRAFENVFVRFEIVMDIGGWRDLHRHRMHTQQRQRFSPHHGFYTPPELLESGFAAPYQTALGKVEALYEKIAKHDPELAQYAVCLAHRIRFMQYQNLRQFFWETELRSIPEGHPNYRYIEQEKFRLLEKIYPNLLKHARVNLGDYVFARRGQDEKVKQKEKDMKILEG